MPQARSFAPPFILRPGTLPRRRSFEVFMELGYPHPVLQELDQQYRHVATVVCPKENADVSTYLLRKTMTFEPIESHPGQCILNMLLRQPRGLEFIAPGLMPSD